MEPGNVLSYTKSTACMNMENGSRYLYFLDLNWRIQIPDKETGRYYEKSEPLVQLPDQIRRSFYKGITVQWSGERDRPVEYLLELIQKVTEVNFEIENKTIVLMHK